ncbi:MAG: endonuclease III [Rhodospirillales bacterium]|nr:endonuclease III [Rhodospirillales bacterium]
MATRAKSATKAKQSARAPDAGEITKRLLQRYPDPKIALHFSSPLELLMAVILSAQCTDARVNEVTKTLFKKYRRAADYANTDPAVFEQEIRSTGFYRNKAKTVIACGRKLVDDFKGEVPRTVDDLVTLPGVGRKTANMVRGNAFGQQAIAVDTHVLRVSNRLGLVKSEDAEEVEAALAAAVPADKHTAFANAMILHGRETCTARSPRCGACALWDLCPWPDKAPR